MADTANYGWSKPTVGGSGGAWGTLLNTIVDDIDSQVHTVDVTAAAALPMAGGTMTGQLALKTETLGFVDAGSVSGAHTFDCSAAQAFAATMTAALSPSFSNVPSSGVLFGVLLWLTNGGSAAITWPSGMQFPDGAPPVLTNSGTDVLAFFTRDGGTTWTGLVLALNVQGLA